MTAEAALGGTQRLHSTDDRCFYCATDADIARADNGWEGRTVHMDLAEDQCPFWAPDDDEETP